MCMCRYGEYQYVCSTEQILAKECFSSVDHFQLFDLTVDPFQLYNVYNQTSGSYRHRYQQRFFVALWLPPRCRRCGAARTRTRGIRCYCSNEGVLTTGLRARPGPSAEIKSALAAKLRLWYPCQGTGCP